MQDLINAFDDLVFGHLPKKSHKHPNDVPVKQVYPEAEKMDIGTQFGSKLLDYIIAGIPALIFGLGISYALIRSLFN